MKWCLRVGLRWGVIGTLFLGAAAGRADEPVDLAQAVVVVRSGPRGPAETMAATMLVEEVDKRTGTRFRVQDNWPTDTRPVIALAVQEGDSRWSDRIPAQAELNLPAGKAEGFAICQTRDEAAGAQRVFVIGTDGRGVMYGVGRLLRELRCRKGAVKLAPTFRAAAAPEYPIRGHQIDYRARANSYDAWTPEQYEQYIRELVVFGANCIENIPFEDAQKSPLMLIPREEMNRRLSEICAKYDVDYWVWTPADFPLTDESRRRAALEQHEAFYRACARLDAVFFPGGDPGDNPPEPVIPFLKDLAGLLAKYHPKAKVWVSLQGFDRRKALQFLEFVEKETPSWLGGLVAGPSSPPMGQTRLRLPKQYKLRWYPDITHTVRCQYPVEWWDPAFALTLGREPPNPRPSDYTTIFRLYAPYTDGFLTYSDGINDDANKAVWSMLGWDPRRDVREMLIEYSRFFFGTDVADEAADGLLGLENNWRGSLALNGGVDGVLALWQRLERQAPHLLKDWRFQMYLMRAYYDAYTRHRLIRETSLERDAMAALARAGEIGPERAMNEAAEVLRRAEAAPCRPEWRRRILELAEDLFKSIGYQTSVRRYHASGAERGCVLDFLDYPLNNRWWIEDEFAKIRKLGDEKEKLARLELIRTWEDPGPGSFYDDIGHVGKSPHVIRGEGMNTDPEVERHDNPEHSWWDDGMSRRRLSWQHHMRWPVGVAYEGLDPAAMYVVRVTGQGECLLRADGVRLKPTQYSKAIGEFKEFPVPRELTSDGRLRLTWDDIDESHLNWRQQSNVAEVWLLRR
jgi:hypothetical protein